MPQNGSGDRCWTLNLNWEQHVVSAIYKGVVQKWLGARNKTQKELLEPSSSGCDQALGRDSELSLY